MDSTESGTPNLRKSAVVYCPGPLTMMLVWYPMGVAKQQEPASINTYVTDFNERFLAMI